MLMNCYGVTKHSLVLTHLVTSPLSGSRQREAWGLFRTYHVPMFLGRTAQECVSMTLTIQWNPLPAMLGADPSKLLRLTPIWWPPFESTSPKLMLSARYSSVFFSVLLEEWYKHWVLSWPSDKAPSSQIQAQQYCPRPREAPYQVTPKLGGLRIKFCDFSL